MHSKQDSDIVQIEICKFLKKDVIMPTEREREKERERERERRLLFYSNIFTRKKRDDTYRIILNFKKFYDFLLVPHSKLECIEDTLNHRTIIL